QLEPGEGRHRVAHRSARNRRRAARCARRAGGFTTPWLTQAGQRGSWSTRLRTSLDMSLAIACSLWMNGAVIVRPDSCSRQKRQGMRGMNAGIRAIALGLTLLLPGRAVAEEIVILAATSLTDALREIGEGYEATSGNHLTFNFGASNDLARQIRAGAPADIFFSADLAQMEGLEREGLGRRASTPWPPSPPRSGGRRPRRWSAISWDRRPSPSTSGSASWSSWAGEHARRGRRRDGPLHHPDRAPRDGAEPRAGDRGGALS